MRNISTILIALFVVTSGVAQEALWGGQAIISPEINEDKSVTFRLNVLLAEKVEVTGDFLPRKIIKSNTGEYDIPGTAVLVKNNKGVWEFTTPEPLTSELYSYSFNVRSEEHTSELQSRPHLVCRLLL